MRRHPGAPRRQRGGRQARHPDHADCPAGRAAAREAGFPPELWQVVVGPGPRSAARRRPRRLRLLHRLDRDRPADRAAVRRPADRLLARARRQEPDARPARRRPATGRPRAPSAASFSNAGQLCVSIERIFVADQVYDPFVDAFVVAHGGDDARRQPRLGRRHGLADLAGPARHGHRPCRRRRRQGRAGAHRRPGPARPRPLLLRADHARGRHRRHDVLRRRDVRPGGLALPLPRRGRGDRARQRRRLRPQRLDLRRDGARGRAPRAPHQVRHGQRQRGLRRDLRLARRADGRHARVRHGPPPGRRGHPPLHRGAVRRDAAAGADRADARDVGGDQRQGDDRRRCGCSTSWAGHDATASDPTTTSSSSAPGSAARSPRCG